MSQRVTAAIFFSEPAHIEAIAYSQFLERHGSHVIDLGEVSIHVDGPVWEAFCERVRLALEQRRACMYCRVILPAGEGHDTNICQPCEPRFAIAATTNPAERRR